MFGKLLSLFGGKAAAPEDPRAVFAAEVEGLLRSLPGVTEVKPVEGAFAFDVVGSHGDRRVFLDNVFAETRELSPGARRDRIAMFFGPVATGAPDEAWDDAVDTFVPVLRGATYGLEAWMQQPGARFLRRPFLPFVDAIVAMDRPTSMSFVSEATAARWAVEPRQVFEAASARLPLLADPSVTAYDETHGTAWAVASNDTYESSRLLVPGWLASFRGKVEGNPVAIVPERSTLLVGGDARPDMVEWLLEKAGREFGASSRRLSPAPYTADGEGRVVPYLRADLDALAIKVKIAHEKLAAYEYGHQKEVLEAAYAKGGPDVFVATYRVHGAEGALPRSLCVWTKDVRSYLPRTERVVMMVLGDRKGDKPKATVEVPFEAIEDRLTPVPGVYPTRYETTGDFPGQGELDTLAAPRA